MIPGIMEAIRMKYGSQKPAAWLSRSVAGTKNKTVIFTFPGSVHAVEEYFTEVVKVLEHLILMIHQLDVH